jgi:hypothetical protein
VRGTSGTGVMLPEKMTVSPSCNIEVEGTRGEMVNSDCPLAEADSCAVTKIPSATRTMDCEATSRKVLKRISPEHNKGFAVDCFL